MSALENKRVLLGVGGSIAAYRACDLIRMLRKEGADVVVAPTKAATAFVTGVTFEALCGRPVLTNPLEVEDGRIPHIEHAYEADLALVAPATADLLAKMATGIADEALLLTLLSLRAPLVVAPAMETRMWEHPATQRNAKMLVERGAQLVGPVAGPLASGRSGKGRLADIEDILESCRRAMTQPSLAGRNVVVTAGPTAEDVDPVRFLTNRSSGRMGIEIARAAARRGANVTLVHGPVSVPLPTPVPTSLGDPATESESHTTRPTGGRIRCVSIRSAVELCAETTAAAETADIAILAAAVADYRPASVATEKIKKTDGALDSIPLERTPDTLATLVEKRRDATRPLLVGFAAETGNLDDKARAKLARKGCDVLCANDVAAPGVGFQSAENAVTLFFVGGRELTLPRATKTKVAGWILDEVTPLLPNLDPTDVK